LGTITVNLIFSYKPPRTDVAHNLTHMDELLANSKLNHATLVIGDLNMDVLSLAGAPLTNFMETFGFENMISSPTRTSTARVNSLPKTSSTLIDVCFTNAKICASMPIDCPFSDHDFIFPCMSLKVEKKKGSLVSTRRLNEAALNQINERLMMEPFDIVDTALN
jgi:hypothetical protein